jgi:hypothetical protein
MRGTCPTGLLQQTACASTLIYVCAAALCVLGCAAIAFFYAELNSVTSLSKQPLEAISYLLGEAVMNEVDDTVYNIAAATRLLASKIVVSNEMFLKHDANATLHFLEVLMRNDTFVELNQINLVSGDGTHFVSLTESLNRTNSLAWSASGMYASLWSADTGCKRDFYYPSWEPFPSAGQNEDCTFNATAALWYRQVANSNPGELVWGMDLDGPSLTELAKTNQSSQARMFCALSISDDGQKLGTVGTLSHAPAIVTKDVEDILTDLVQTSSTALLSDAVVCLVDRGSGELLMAKVNDTDATTAVQRCNQTQDFVKTHFGGDLQAVVSDVWVEGGQMVISTHTPLLPVRLGRTGRIDWVLWISDDAQHLLYEQQVSIIVTLAIALSGIIVVGGIMCVVVEADEGAREGGGGCLGV